MTIKELAEKYDSYIIEKRRYFHQHPEPSWHEFNTTEVIEKELKAMGIETTRFEKTGVAGIIKGAKPGKTVALRADIDALSIEEKADVPFQSENKGFMHACGHDCHASMLLGAAKILSEIKDDLEGNVKFIFQSAEETADGAKYYIEQGFLDDVDAIFGMHIFGTMPTCKINIEGGGRMASADWFTIKVKGLAAHGSAPNLGHDAIVAAASIVMNLQTVVSRINSPLEPLVLTIGTINGGDRFNIIPQNVVMEGTLRTFSRDFRNKSEEIMRKIIKDTASALGCEADIEYGYVCGPTANDDAELNTIAHDAAVSLYGEEGLIPMERITGSEDFAYYMEKVPGVFAFLGCSNPEIGAVYGNHSDMFKVDEEALHRGAAFYAQFAHDYLKKSKK